VDWRNGGKQQLKCWKGEAVSKIKGWAEAVGEVGSQEGRDDIGQSYEADGDLKDEVSVSDEIEADTTGGKPIGELLDDTVVYELASEEIIEVPSLALANTRLPDVSDTLEQQIIDEIQKLTLLPSSRTSYFGEQKYALDITDTELKGVQFLIAHAGKTEKLDYFKIVQQILEVKRCVSDSDAKHPDSPNLDALIDFIETVANSEADDDE
jgi:hypothetical protein